MNNPKLRRHVFYFHGFDRRGPRFFNLWQKREARAYVARHGGCIEIGDIESDGWSISSRLVETRFHFMDWTGVIRDRFKQPFWIGMRDMFSLCAVALRQGLFGKIRRADRAIGLLMIWAFLPMVLFILGLVAAMFAGVFAILIVGCFGLAAFWALHRYDRYFGVYYALHIAWAARRMALRDDPNLEACMAAFRAVVQRAEADEIILAGHSVGNALAIQCVEMAPRSAKLLTIGQSIPLVSFQNEASDVRAALDQAKKDQKCWIDVSAGRDPLGFCAFDPSGGSANCISAHFGRTFGAKTLRALKWRGFDMHFLYFHAAETLGASWNWFGVLAGEVRLEERFEGDKTMEGTGSRRARF